MHALATLICYDVLEDVPCPSPSMKCCVDVPPSNTTENGNFYSNSTMISTTTEMTTVEIIPTTTAPATKPPEKVLFGSIKYQTIIKVKFEQFSDASYQTEL